MTFAHRLCRRTNNLKPGHKVNQNTICIDIVRGAMLTPNPVSLAFEAFMDTKR